MESKENSELINTKYMIFQRCKKDHFNYVNDLPVTKQRSLYENQISQPNKKKQNIQQQQIYNCPTLDKEFFAKKVTEGLSKRESLQPISSVYRSSFESLEKVKAPTRAHEQQSFFKKQNHFEAPESTYNRMSLHIKDENKILYGIDKGKGRSDNLGIPKYNRMNSSSLYKMEFNDKIFEKLPSIKQKEVKKAQNKKLIKRTSSLRKLDLIRQ